MSLILGSVITVLLSGFSFLYFNYLDGEKTKSYFIFNLFETLDLQFNDFKYKVATKNDLKNQQTILVAVDDESIDEVGRWP